jgi:GntR family transcriptional regulator/MocR family aminotransferase
VNRSNPVATNRSKEGPDFLQLDVGEAPPGGLSDRLAEKLRAAISDGRLAIGSRLPASRVLAAELRVSRGVVTEAYQRLTEDGHVAGRGRAGTIVVSAPLTTTPRAAQPAGPGRARNRLPEADLDVFDTMRATPARIDLTPGVPDLAAFPRAAWLRAERTVLRDLSASAFGYGDPAGTPTLRLAVANWLARNRGITADPDDIIIVAGVSQALALIAQVLRRADITEIAVEDPSSLGSRQHLQLWGLRTPPIPVDSDGLRVDKLVESGAKVVLATPAHHFPMGVVLEGERRRDLIRWAVEGGLIVEDDYDAEHRYDRAPVAAVQASAPDRVAYTGSTSKSLAPSTRLGWLIAPRPLQAGLLAAKHASDLGNPALPQLVLAHLLAGGDYERHLRNVRIRQRRRRDALLAGLRTRLPQARVEGVAAGLHLLLTLPWLDGRIEDTVLAERIAEHGVVVHPLSWHRHRPGPPGLVMGYAAHPPDRLAQAAELLARAVPTAAR